MELDLQNPPMHLVIKQALRSRMETLATVHKNAWEEKNLLSVESQTQTQSVFLGQDNNGDLRESYLFSFLSTHNFCIV